VRYFKIEEFDCQHTGKNEMNPEFLERIDTLRLLCGFPFIITSGYRDPSHPIEARKGVPGTNPKGIACDIQVKSSTERYRLLDNALRMGFSGIGVADDFIHLDQRKATKVMWVY
jgi:uncharacterized protein YcbK (DUF882 family)